MPYRRSGVQYDINHVTNPQSPQDPIFSSTSTPYLSSSPILIRMDRELVSVGVGPESTIPPAVVTTPSANIMPQRSPTTPLCTLNRQSSVSTLLSPFSGDADHNMSYSRSLTLDGALATAIQGAIRFLERNGYTCLPHSSGIAVQNLTEPTHASGNNQSSPSVFDNSSTRKTMGKHSKHSQKPGKKGDKSIATDMRSPAAIGVSKRKRKLLSRKNKFGRTKKERAFVFCSNVTQLSINIGTT